MRIDKWLWAARFFKTRGLAQTAVAGGKVKLISHTRDTPIPDLPPLQGEGEDSVPVKQSERVKPAKEIVVGDELAIRIGEYEWVVTVKGLSERRGPAAVATKLYEESEESRVRRMAQIAERKAHGSVGGERKGRPTKRERRQIIRFKGKEEG